jgi:hypothetical protein
MKGMEAIWPVPPSSYHPAVAPPCRSNRLDVRADLYLKLAANAWDRMKSRRDVEWKAAIAIWTLFGAGTFGVLASSSTLHWGSIPLAFVGDSAVVFVYGWWWIPYIAETMRRISLTSGYWQFRVLNIIGRQLPLLLEPAVTPGPDVADLWVRMPTEAPFNLQAPADLDAKKRRMGKWYRSQRCQFWLVLVFGLFFVLAAVIKAIPGGAQDHLVRDAPYRRGSPVGRPNPGHEPPARDHPDRGPGGPPPAA